MKKAYIPRHQVEIIGDRRGLYGHFGRVASGSYRLLINREQEWAALVSKHDLWRMERLDELEWLAEEAEQDPEFRKALDDEGVPVEAIRRLFADSGGPFLLRDRARQAVRDARFRAALEEAGTSVSWPTGEPFGVPYRSPLLEAGDPPLSEQIIAERR